MYSSLAQTARPHRVASTLADLAVVAGKQLAYPGTVRQEIVGVHGFTYNLALPGPPDYYFFTKRFE